MDATETLKEGGMMTEDALDDTGFVMMFGTGVEKVKKAAGLTTDVIMGFNIITSRDPQDVAQTDWPVTIMKPRRGLVLDLQLELAANRTTDIVYGSEIVVADTTAGTVMHATDNANGKRIGYAREAVGAGVDPSDGKILVEVNAE